MTTQIKSTEQAKKLESLGYALHSGVKDILGRTRKYGTFPISGGGACSHFDNTRQIDKYIQQVENIRQIYQDIEEGLI